MARTITPKLSWLLTVFCIGYFPTFGMRSVQNTHIDRTYNLEALREEFIEILERQPEFIDLDSAESQYNVTNGTYKLFPYYQKISPEPLKLTDSRFIIQKHVITGQWQLTEIFDYYWSKNIKAFPVTEENENNALLHNQFIKSQCTHSNTIDELEKTIFNANMEVKANNTFISSLTAQKEILMKRLNKQRQELAKQTKIVKELESILIKKENEICDLGKKMKSLLIVKEKELSELSKIHNAKLIAKQNEICNISKAQTKLENDLIEKENEIRDIFKTENKLQSTLSKKENEIRNLENQIQRYKKITNANQNKIKSLQAENCSNTSDLKQEIESSKENVNLLEKEKQTSNQELLKYQALHKKLECEGVTWQKKEKVLKDMMDDYEKKIKELTEKLKQFDKIMLETSPRELNNSAIKENGHTNESQIQDLDNEKFTKAENHASKKNLENEIDSNKNVEIEEKEKLQKYESTMKQNHESLMLENHENKKTLTNEDNLQENPVIITSEADETKANFFFLNSHKKTIKKKLTKYNPENNLKALEFEEDYLETVPKTQTLKVKSKEEKQMKRKNEKKQNKILNDIEQMLLKLMPTVNKNRSEFYNELLTARKNEYEDVILAFVLQLKQSEDGDLMSKIKYFLENKETLIEGSDPKYQYESLLMNIGVIHFAHYMIDSLKPIGNCPRTSFINDDYVEYIHLVAEMQNLYEKHEKIFDDILESVKDKKLKIKVKCFRENECLFTSQKYEYEKLFRTIGYIVYGYGNDVKLENQNLKNETVLIESIKSVVREEKQNVANETNIEIHLLEALPIEIYANSIKSAEQMEHEENEAKVLKLKEKIVIEDKQMLNIIEHILYTSCPSPFKKTSSQFNEVLAGKKMGEYKSRVSKLLQDLINNKDSQMISNITYFLETKNFLSANILFEYEFILMHHGAMIYNHGLLIEVELILKTDLFLKLAEDAKNKFRKRYPTMQKLYKHHEEIVAYKLQALEDETMKLKIKCFQENQWLYDSVQYKYEYFIMTIGIIVYGCGGHLKGL